MSHPLQSDSRDRIEQLLGLRAGAIGAAENREALAARIAPAAVGGHADRAHVEHMLGLPAGAIGPSITGEAAAQGNEASGATAALFMVPAATGFGIYQVTAGALPRGGQTTPPVNSNRS